MFFLHILPLNRTEDVKGIILLVSLKRFVDRKGPPQFSFLNGAH